MLFTRPSLFLASFAVWFPYDGIGKVLKFSRISDRYSSQVLYLAWNAGTCMFMIWTGLMCLIFFINSIIWKDNAINVAPVYCDISKTLPQQSLQLLMFFNSHGISNRCRYCIYLVIFSRQPSFVSYLDCQGCENYKGGQAPRSRGRSCYWARSSAYRTHFS